MKLIYMGTPEFAVPALEYLTAAGHQVAAVLTQPDRPRDRGMQNAPPPVKQAALALGIPVYQPETLKDRAIAPLLDEIKPDAICVVAYGKLLPGYVLRAPRYGCINVHASLLPKYRGSCPMQAALIHGDEVTGVTTMYMAKGLDTGDIILQEETLILESDTLEDIHDRLMEMGAALLCRTLALLETGEAPRIPQDDSQASHTALLCKDDGRLDWNQSARQVFNRARAMTPWPGAYSYVNGEPLKLYGVTLTGERSDAPAGTVLGMKNGLLQVVCGDGGVVAVEELQPRSKRRMAAAAYCCGHSVPERLCCEENQ